MLDTLIDLWQLTGFPHLTWQMLVMWAVSFTLLYLAVYRGFEPLLLVPIAFGALLANLPTQGLVSTPPGEVLSPVSGVVLRVDVREDNHVHQGDNVLLIEYTDATTGMVRHRTLKTDLQGRIVDINVRPGDEIQEGEPLYTLYKSEPSGFFHYLYYGIKLELFPPLIFLGVGALTDFGPLIANPRMLLLGGAAQLGVLFTFFCAAFMGFQNGEAAAISIIGGADGPTAIFLASSLAPELLPPIAVAAYCYMALVPLIQPPIIRALTSKKERAIKMQSLRTVGKMEKMLFCLIVTMACILLVPPAASLIGMLMLGNFLRECGVTERLVKSAQNEIINIVTIFLGACVGITMTGERFLQQQTLFIILLGVIAFAVSTAGGVLMAKFMNVFLQKPINPIIGAAGVSAVPMAARVAHLEGQRADPTNYLLMHAMGPNVAGVIGTALVAGYFLATLAK